MNVVNSIASRKEISCVVFTTENKINNWFKAENIKIKRIAKQYNNAILRYWFYILFNFKCLIGLVINNPNSILVYETYSVLPAYLYKNLFKKVNLIIHFHEYESSEEIKKSSAYSKFLHKIQVKLLKKAAIISQTNNDRKQLFLQDNPYLSESKIITLPNYPPKEWFEYSKKNTIKNDTGVTKIVHVGAVSLDTMYTQEIVHWIIAQNGAYVLDFYTNNITKEAKYFLDNVSNNNIRLLQGVNYFNLPKTLINYDIGLTLYKGHIPNYIYNVPNKVLEYIACGLGVWYSSELISTQKFINENSINNCIKINFSEVVGLKIQASFVKIFSENFYKITDDYNLNLDKLLLEKQKIK